MLGFLNDNRVVAKLFIVQVQFAILLEALDRDQAAIEGHLHLFADDASHVVSSPGQQGHNVVVECRHSELLQIRPERDFGEVLLLACKRFNDWLLKLGHVL